MLKLRGGTLSVDPTEPLYYSRTDMHLTRQGCYRQGYIDALTWCIELTQEHGGRFSWWSCERIQEYMSTLRARWRQ